MTARKIFWIFLVFALMIWEAIGLYYWWEVRERSSFQSSEDAHSSVQTLLPQVKVGNYEWPLLHPVVTDVNLRLEGLLKDLQADRFEIARGNESVLLFFDEKVKFYLQEQGGQISQTNPQDLAKGQLVEISLSREADGTFRVESVIAR